jgi:hypothetical protein
MIVTDLDDEVSLLEDIMDHEWCNAVAEHLLGKQFSWHYAGLTASEDRYGVNPTPNSIDTPQMYHIFYWDDGIEKHNVQNNWNIVGELCDKIYEAKSDKISKLLRVRANLTFPSPYYPDNVIHHPHVDWLVGNRDLEVPHYSVVYYLTGSSGNTNIFEEKITDTPPNTDPIPLTQKYSVPPNNNCAVWFSSDSYHSGSPSKITVPKEEDITKHMIPRVIFNIVWEGKNG